MVFLFTHSSKQWKTGKHTFMYWELGPQRAVRKGNWKAYRDKKGNWELYDLSSDIEEQIDLAHKKEKVLKELIALAESSHQPARLEKFLIRHWLIKTAEKHLMSATFSLKNPRNNSFLDYEILSSAYSVLFICSSNT